VKASDIGGLIALATDDIVVVHGNGKAAIGVDALRADLKHDFGIFDVKLRDASAKIIVHDKWAIEFCEVDQVVSGVKGGSGVQTHSRIVAAFSLNQEPEIVSPLPQLWRPHPQTASAGAQLSMVCVM